MTHGLVHKCIYLHTRTYIYIYIHTHTFTFKLSPKTKSWNMQMLQKKTIDSKHSILKRVLGLLYCPSDDMGIRKSVSFASSSDPSKPRKNMDFQSSVVGNPPFAELLSLQPMSLWPAEWDFWTHFLFFFVVAASFEKLRIWKMSFFYQKTL